MYFNPNPWGNGFEIDFVPNFTEKIAPKMIEAGIEILEDAVRKSLESEIGVNLNYPKRNPTQLVASVRDSHVFHEYAGRRFRANIYFDGKRNRNGKKIRNGEIAAYKEYGTPNTPDHAQEPSFFIKNANVRVKRRVEAVMKQVLEDELKIMEE